jgi:cysteine synthase A
VHRSPLTSIVEAVGRTPLVRLNRVAGDAKPPIYLKLEWYGPSGSLKDRIYKHMFEQAERRGDLHPGMEVLECSTGNAGTACAFMAATKGYPCTIVMPAGMSDERKKLMQAYGARLVFTPGGESDVDLSLRKLEELRAASPERYWVPGQFDNPDNVEAHYLTTGPEVWEQTGGQLAAWVGAQGSGGGLTGIGRYLRERNPRIQVYAVEPDECALLTRQAWGEHGIEGIGDGFVPRNLDLSLLAGQEWGEHGIEGIGDGFVPHNLDLSILAGVITTTTDESVAMAQRLAREEGIFCGISSGCNVAAACKLARRHPELASIATLINDTGQRYFSTALCGEPKHVEVPEREHPLDERSAHEIATYKSGWEIIG